MKRGNIEWHNNPGLWNRIDSIRIQHFSLIQIRIHKMIESGSNVDPDLKRKRRKTTRILPDLNRNAIGKRNNIGCIVAAVYKGDWFIAEICQDQDPHLRKPNPGFNPGFTPSPSLYKRGSESQVKPGVWCPEMWAQVNVPDG
jgi:hypothetical protein